MSSAAAREPADPASLKAAARVAELFERHGRMAFGISRAMLRNVHDAEDATQQVFLSAHRALLGGATVRDSAAWIATIARNECRGRISAGMRNPLPVAHEDLADLPAGVDEVEQRLRARELFEALATLPERQREAIVLRYVYGLRYGEVSKALGISRPATEALLFRARRAMRVHLRPIAGSVLVVPLAVREELASALPGFESQAGVGAGAGLAGGLLAKLASAPMAAKIGTVTIAVSAVATVGAVQSEGTARATPDWAPAVRDIAGAIGSPAMDDVSPAGVAVERLSVVRRSRAHEGKSAGPADSRGGRGDGGRSLAADPVSSSDGDDDESDARDRASGTDGGNSSEVGHESSGPGRGEEERETSSSGSSAESNDGTPADSSGSSGSGSDESSAGSGSSGSDSSGSSEAAESDHHDSSGPGSGGGSDDDGT